MTAESSDDLLGRAEAAYRQAVADPAAASPVAAAIVAEARRVDDVEAVVVALRAQAWSARGLLAGESAKALLDDAVRLARRRGLVDRLGLLLVSRGAVNHELGRSRAAQADLSSARPLLAAAGLSELELQHAVIFQNTGQVSAAASRYRRVVADRRSAGDVRVKALNNLGLIEAELGHYDVAWTLLQQAHELAHEVGPALRAYVTEGRAWVAARSGRLPASLELFDQAEQLYEAAGLPRAELYSEQADAMSDLRLLPEATAAARRAVDEFTASGASLMRADARIRLSRLALLANNLNVATAEATLAEDDFRRQRRPHGTASASVLAIEARARAGTATSADLRRVRSAAARLDGLDLAVSAVEAHFTAARLALNLGRPAWALASLDRAYALSRRGAVLTRLQGRVAAATGAGLRGDDRRVLQHCRTGLADLARHRAVLASTELRVLASAHGAELGHVGLRSLVRSGSPVQIFAWLERTRAAALLAVQRTEVQGVEVELAALRSLQAEIDATGGGSPAAVARHAALENRLRRVTWARTAEQQSAARPTPVAQIRELLGDRVLVEYGILDGNIFAAVVSRRRTSLVHLSSLETVRHELDGLFFVLRLLSRRTARAGTPALRRVAEQRVHRLRELLIAPVSLIPPSTAARRSPDLSRARPFTDRDAEQEVVIVPAGLLQRVPWSALHPGPVSVAPSASFWARARLRRPLQSSDVVLVAGPGLAAAGEEVRRLAALYDHALVLDTPHSTVGRVADALKTARLVHFACHGRVRSDNPMFSGLELSDGSLTVQEMDLRDIAPHRIVLAACEAAADVTYPGEEMLGFVSALLAGGTAGIVASTILVPDTAAVPMMLALHERMRGGEAMAVALHSARREMDREDPHELVNWCGFTAYGAA